MKTVEITRVLPSTRPANTITLLDLMCSVQIEFVCLQKEENVLFFQFWFLIFSIFPNSSTHGSFCLVLIFFSLVLPHINPFSFDGNVNSGDSVQLICHVAKGDLPLKIKWLFNNNPIFAHLNVVTSKLNDRSSFLTIPAVSYENSGNYTCVSWNEAGHSNYTAKLNVLGTILSRKIACFEFIDYIFCSYKFHFYVRPNDISPFQKKHIHFL